MAKPDDQDVTELTLLDASKVSAVGTPANGTPWLVLKSTAATGEEEDEPTTSEKFKENAKRLKEGKSPSKTPVKTSAAEKSDSAEADAQQEELTGEAAKAKESGKTQNDLPDSAFAYIEPDGEKDSEGKTTPRSKRHFPIHDEAHARNALARASQSPFGDKALPKIKAAAKKFGIKVTKQAVKRYAKALDIELPEGWVEKCVGPQLTAVGALDTPKEAGHLNTSSSGTSGSVTSGVEPKPSTVPTDRNATSQPGLTTVVAGGESTYTIPDESKVIDNPVYKARAISSLVEAIDMFDEQRQAIKDGKFLTALGVTSPPSVPITDLSTTLASCCRTLEEHLQQERLEATLNPAEANDVWDMEDAKCALESATRLVAFISAMESAESAEKSGQVLSGKNLTALETAHKHLSDVLDGAKKETGDAGTESTMKEEMLHMDISTEQFVAGIREVVKAERKAEKKAAKMAAEEAAEAEKNANNDGDITAQQEEAGVKGETDAANIQSVGGSVDSQYVNKGEGEGDEPEPDPAMKKIEDGLEKLSKQVEQFSKRPRSGGPSLDGQARGVAPAAEGRQGEVTKSEGDVIESLTKALADETNPVVKDELGRKLTYERLVRMHEQGQL